MHVRADLGGGFVREVDGPVGLVGIITGLLNGEASGRGFSKLATVAAVSRRRTPTTALHAVAVERFFQLISG